MFRKTKSKLCKKSIEKMYYDPESWKTLFEKMDTQNPETRHQTPQII